MNGNYEPILQQIIDAAGVKTPEEALLWVQQRANVIPLVSLQGDRFLQAKGVRVAVWRAVVATIERRIDEAVL